MDFPRTCFFWIVILLLSPDVACAGQAAAPLPGTAILGPKHHGAYQLIDQHGRRVTIQQPFNRIISLYGAHTENLFSLGLDPEIIGVGRSDDFPPEARQKQRFSPRDDPEKFLASKPDLVLVRPMLDRGYARLFKRLEQNGITVVSLQPGNKDEMLLYWEKLGQLTGRTGEARLMIERFNRAVASFGRITSTLHPKKHVYFEAIHDKMKTFTQGAMADFALTTAGGINVAADGTPSRGTNIAIYGKERILSKASRIDVFISQQGSMNRITVDTIRNEPGFQVIKAVRENQILMVDEAIVSRPTLRLLHGIAFLGTYLYPDHFQEPSKTIAKDIFNPK